MRAVRLLTGLFALSLTAVAAGQTGSYDTTVVVPEAEVRCGPSANYYATSKLRQGAPVKVVEEKDGGWLAIEPPEGSFSWIEARLLGKQAGHQATVMVPEAPVRAGSALLERTPDVVSTKLLMGAQVVILGEGKVAPDGSRWLPIEAQKELRFIPKTAVKAPASPVEMTAVKAGMSPQPAPAPTAATAEETWQQAEQALATGNISEARRLYQLCLQQPGVDSKLTWWCHSRLQSLAATQPPPQPQPNVAVMPPTPAPSTQGQASAYSPRPAATGSSSSPGMLRRAGFPIDGKQAYALTDSAGRLVMYVTAQPGVNLEQWVGRSVSLWGTVAYHGDLKRDYMMATGATPLP